MSSTSWSIEVPSRPEGARDDIERAWTRAVSRQHRRHGPCYLMSNHDLSREKPAKTGWVVSRGEVSGGEGEGLARISSACPRHALLAPFPPGRRGGLSSRSTVEHRPMDDED